MPIRWIHSAPLLLAALASAAGAAAPRVVINEIHFDPADTVLIKSWTTST